MKLNSGPGSISPNFVCQAKSCRRTEFGKKINVLFHSKIKICALKFDKSVLSSHNLCTIWQTFIVRKFLILFARKLSATVGEIDPRYWKSNVDQGVDFINILTLFFCKNRMRSVFFGKQIGHTAKKCANVGLKFGVLIVGEIEQQIFCRPATLRLVKKVWWNRPHK